MYLTLKVTVAYSVKRQSIVTILLCFSSTAISNKKKLHKYPSANAKCNAGS